MPVPEVEITVKCPVNALTTDDTKAEFLYIVAVTVARALEVDLEKVDVDLQLYANTNVQRNTLVSMEIAALEYPERMANIKGRLAEIDSCVRRGIDDTFHQFAITEQEQMLSMRFTPVRADYWT